MSNCVSVQGEIRFSGQTMELPELHALIERVTPLRSAPPDSDRDGYFAYWFLSGGAMSEAPNGDLIWTPGNGRSSHTWRDLLGTLSTLSKFAKTTLTFSLRLRDEDWPTRWSRMTAVILPSGGGSKLF